MPICTRRRIYSQPLALLLATLIALGLSAPLYSLSAAEEYPVSGSGEPGSFDPLQPIQIGARELVGKPRLGQKAASSAIGGLLGSVMGGSSRKEAQPRTQKDPSRKLSYNNLVAESFDTETHARGLWTKDGLLISARLEESPGKGTFQSLFLESCDGRRLYPQRYEIYDLWNESSLSVSWSSSSTSNGKVISQQSGGFSDSWNEGFSSHAGVSVANGASVPGVWQQLGFDRAQGGVRQIGAYFNVTATELMSLGELGLFIHSSRPLTDPVTTAPAHWLIAAGDQKQPQLMVPIQSPDSADDAHIWQTASQVCGERTAVLVAAAGQVNPGSEPFEGTARPPKAAANSVTPSKATTAVVQQGLPIPAGLTISAKGTGRTTGHIITISAVNDHDRPIEWPALNFYVPSSGRFQSYVGRTPATPIPPGSTVEIPVTGYCADVHKPPVPADEPMPSTSEWVTVSGTTDQIVIPPRDSAGSAGRANVPGTDVAVPRAVSPNEPQLLAPLLVAAMTEIEQKTIELQASGALQTPYSGNLEREREAIVQQTFWIYASELEGEPYTREEFTARLEQQYEDRSGVAITAAPQEDRERVQQGADDFWDSFELVGLEAKVLRHPDVSAPTAGTAVETELKPTPVPGTSPPPENPPADGCKSNEHIQHSARQVNVVIADSYGDADSRQKISAGIKEAVESENSAYVTSTPPSTAYAIWRDDSIGGISSAYAKSVFLEKNGQDWVWSTDPMKTSAKGSGIHTLAFQPGPGCKATVAGAALMWMKSSSEAFDPLERSIEVFRALDAVKELSVEYVAGKLPPGISDAVEAGVDAMTDPASDTYAAASGTATLQVGGRTDGGRSANRVVYKRKDKEDKAIIGGGATVKKLFTSDVRPNSLTSKIDAAVNMEAGATGNGFAKAYMESFYGTLLVGVCECPDSTSYRVLTDTNMFIRSDAVKGAVDVAMRDMQAVAERIGKDIESGAQEIDSDKLRERVEGELRNWGEGTAGDRFKPEAGQAGSE